MANNYDFLDAHSSVLTARSSVTAGSAQEPYVIVSSIQSMPPVAITGTPSISGTVLIGNAPSIYGNISGSVVAFQGTTPWLMGSVYGNISGSVVAFQAGTQSSSIYAMRNDAVASFLGADLTQRPVAVDSAGRILAKPYAAEEARIEGYVSTTNTSITTLVAAAGAGLRNYITDIWIANTGAAATLVTFSSGGGSSVLGYTIAPAGSGSNLPGLVTPIRTLPNETFGIQAATATSILYATVKGFKAP